MKTREIRGTKLPLPVLLLLPLLGAPVFAMTGDEAVTVLITGFGPTDTVYENPADDPTPKP